MDEFPNLPAHSARTVGSGEAVNCLRILPRMTFPEILVGRNV